MRRTMIRGDEHIEVTVVVEITERGAAAHFGTREIRPRFGRHIAKPVVAAVEEQVRGLRITGIGAQISDGVVDMTVHHQQIEESVEINIEKEAAKPQAALGKPS